VRTLLEQNDVARGKLEAVAEYATDLGARMRRAVLGELPGD
jgi:hypothetical protein